MKNEWLFSDPPDVGVFTSDEIICGKSPILFVTHDIDDGAWQFHAGLNTVISEAKMVSLKEIVELDPLICKLADLPLGSIAFRESADRPWARSKKAK